MTLTLLAIAMVAVLYSLVGRRLSRTVVTAPMLFIGVGAALATSGAETGGARDLLQVVAEVALIVLLFLDAAQIDLAALRRRHVWPVRMLTLGIPLAILFGAGLCAALFPEWPWAAWLLIAAILAPTDAALGQAVVANPAVPERVRRALTVESGLNDGLALPVILFFASLVALAGAEAGETDWVAFATAQLTLGPLAGIACGSVGGRLVVLAKDRGWTAEPYEGVGAIALAGVCYLTAHEIGGNGFVAAFFGGLAFGQAVQGRCPFVYEFTESEGQLLSWSAFALIGLALVPTAISQLTWPMLGVILGSLFVVRPAAIWLSLSWTDATAPTRLFFGWFGPRGLATALFALAVADQLAPAFREQALALAINAVWISALLHGLTAAPGAARYARIVARGRPPGEMAPVEISAKPLVVNDAMSHPGERTTDAPSHRRPDRRPR